MTQGVVIFAYSNSLIDYVAMANWSAKNIHRHLQLPVCLITDQKDIPDHYVFDQVVQTQKQGTNSRYFSDFNRADIWYNHNRLDAYRLSPWQQTLVLDADYVVASDQLLTLFEIDQDFVAHNRAHDITGLEKFNENNYFGSARMPMSWATVMLYRQSATAELIFDSMSMVRDHWDHYRNVFNIIDPTYRNDYALTVAQNIVNGHVLNFPSIPWSLATVSTGQQLTQLDPDTYRVDYVNNRGQARWLTVNQDFHAMGKSYLGAIVANPC